MRKWRSQDLATNQVMVQRILIVMPNWFGETLFATPVLRALRQANPQTHIAALGVPRSQDVLAHNPQLNEMISYDERGTHRAFGAKFRLVSQLRAGGFDAALILRRSLSRTTLLALAKIPRRIGFANRKSGWLLTDRVAMPASVSHKAHAYLRLLEPLGIAASPCAYDYRTSEDEQQQAETLLVSHGVDAQRPFVVLHPGANWSHKRWPPERFGRLGARLMERGVAVAVTGGPHDGALIQDVVRPMPAPPVVLAGRTSVRQLAACLERAALVVSNDTGVMHIACALNRPVVALYGPTSPAITGPLGDPQRTRVLHHPDCCPSIPCYRPDRPPHPGMTSITVDEVYNTAISLLQPSAASSQQSADYVDRI